MLLPAYRSLLKRSKPAHRIIRIWLEGATSSLQECLDSTDWNIFREAATYGQYTYVGWRNTQTGYIEKYMQDVTVVKPITTHANQSPHQAVL